VAQSDKALITITPPNLNKRFVGADICCVIDTSGSMQLEASLKNEKGDSEA